MKKKIIVQEFTEGTGMTCEGGNCELPLINKNTEEAKAKPSKKKEK